MKQPAPVPSVTLDGSDYHKASMHQVILWGMMVKLANGNEIGLVRRRCFDTGRLVSIVFTQTGLIPTNQIIKKEKVDFRERNDARDEFCLMAQLNCSNLRIPFHALPSPKSVVFRKIFWRTQNDGG